MRICIDLDGVICQLRKTDEGYDQLEPVVGAIDKVQALKKNRSLHYYIYC